MTGVHSSVPPSPAPPRRTVREVLPHTAHRCPSPSAFGLVSLGGTVERSLQFSGLINWGGISHFGTHPTVPCTCRMDKVAALPIAQGFAVLAAPAVLRPPPPPCRLPNHFPVLAGYRMGPFRRLSAATSGSARASPVPVGSFRTFRAPYAGEFLGAALQVLHPFRGLRLE